MDEDQFRFMADWVMQQAQQAMLFPDRVDELCRTLELTQTVGPILDPTKYRANAHNIEDLKMIAEAYRRFVNDVANFAYLQEQRKKKCTRSSGS